MLKNFFISIVLLFVFLGCSSKEYYKPADTEDSISRTSVLNEYISEVSADSATLEDGTIITKTGIDKTLFPEGFRFIYKSDEWALGLKVGGEVFAVKNENESRVLKLSKTVATVALKDNLLAVVFADNELALYDFNSGKLLFKEPASEATAVDMRITTPRFLNDLVLFPTLDGKVVIVNAESKELVRKIIVSSEEYFNNIIYFNIVDDVLYAATPYKIYSLGAKESRVELETRNVVVNTKGVWAATKQGEVIALTHNLEIIKKQKFPFAHFLGMVVTDESVYLAEKEEYIIILPLDVESFKVYDFDLEEGYFFTSDEGFYHGDEYIKVK
jgi:outer membrane protein assembly factor BamB